MTKFRKKPVVIDAVQLTKENANDVYDWLLTIKDGNDGIEQSRIEQNFDNGIIIHTLEGNHLAQYGDFIIKGVAGEFYPCKPDIFESTYEEVK